MKDLNDNNSNQDSTENKDSQTDNSSKDNLSKDVESKAPIKESHHVLIMLNDIGLGTSCSFSGASYIVVENKPNSAVVKE